MMPSGSEGDQQWRAGFGCSLGTFRSQSRGHLWLTKRFWWDVYDIRRLGDVPVLGRLTFYVVWLMLCPVPVFYEDMLLQTKTIFPSLEQQYRGVAGFSPGTLRSRVALVCIRLTSLGEPSTIFFSRRKTATKSDFIENWRAVLRIIVFEVSIWKHGMTTLPKVCRNEQYCQFKIGHCSPIFHCVRAYVGNIQCSSCLDEGIEKPWPGSFFAYVRCLAKTGW